LSPSLLYTMTKWLMSQTCGLIWS